MLLSIDVLEFYGSETINITIRAWLCGVIFTVIIEMSDTNTNTTPAPLEEKKVEQEPITTDTTQTTDNKDVPSTSSSEQPQQTLQKSGSKRSISELHEKSSAELVELEKGKLQKIYTLVEEVKKDTTDINSLIVEAKESKDPVEKKEMLHEIQLNASELQDKVQNAAKLEGEVKDINVVLQEKKGVVDAPPAQ